MRYGIAIILALLTAAPSAADHVDVYDGDSEALREAIMYTVPPCTVRIWPGVYPIEGDGWPVVPGQGSGAVLVGIGGADQVVLEGDGSAALLELLDGEPVLALHVQGVTIRYVASLLEQPPSGPEIHSLRIADCILEGLAAGCALCISHAQSGIITGSLIAGWAHGIILNWCHVDVIGNEIHHCFSGFGASPEYEGDVCWNYVHENNQGLSVPYGGSVRNNVVESNEVVGLRFCGPGSGGQSLDNGNVIRWNAVGVEHPGFGFHYNDVYENHEYNLVAGGGPGAETLDATMNWWGTTDPEEIAEGILDRNDTGTGWIVLFEPFCAAPGCDPSTAESRSWGAIKALYR